MIPVVDLRSLWASFLANPTQFALELVAAFIVVAVAVLVYCKTPAKYRIPLVAVYVVALLFLTYWPRPEAVESVAARSLAPARGHNCVTTGANSPIVTGSNSAVVIDGKTYAPGQSSDCEPASTSLSTHGANSPIITGSGSKVIINTER